MGFFSKLFGKKKKKDEPVAEAINNTVKNEEIKEKPAVTAAPKTVKKQETPKNTEKSECEKSKKKNIAGTFDIKKSKDGRYVFNLYAANKVIVATSQIYSSAQSAQNGINSVIANAEKANIEDQTKKDYTPLPFPKWEIYKDKGGQFRFRLSASNGSCICHSQGYTTKASCKNGIESIIRTVKNSKVDKSYIKTN